MLLLLGMPGTGKTMTTKMLAIYYASKGYRIRYTTNGDISDLEPSEREYDHHERDYDYGISGEIHLLCREFCKFGNYQLPNWKRRCLK